MDTNDETLVGACRRGDAAAWDALVGRYQRLVYSIPRRAGLDEDLSSEILQTVFARLVEKLDTIEHPDRLHAWLATTAKRETWRVIARRRAAIVTSLDDDSTRIDVDDLRDEAPLADEEIERFERQREVREAVGELDERCRRLLTMLFYCAEPPPYSEVAAALGVPEGSIGPTRARCLQKLMSRLKNRTQ